MSVIWGITVVCLLMGIALLVSLVIINKEALGTLEESRKNLDASRKNLDETQAHLDYVKKKLIETRANMDAFYLKTGKEMGEAFRKAAADYDKKKLLKLYYNKA